MIRISNFHFSKIELRDLAKAWFAISLAFAILFSGISNALLISFVISAFTVGIGFLFHELGHKFVAQRYGYKAEFRSFDNMLILAVIMSFFGFILAAPGAVMIQAHNIDFRRNGKISAIGPTMNILLAIVFLAILLFTPFTLVGKYGLFINALLAAFNMIPFGNFDGVKIYRWNKLVYALLLISSISLLFFYYTA